MAHIKKLNEMTSSARNVKSMNESILVDTIKKYDSDKINVIESLCDGKYSLTTDCLIALYRHFYTNDIDFFTEFLEYTGKLGDKWLRDKNEWWKFVKLYVAYKLLDNVNIVDIVNAIIDKKQVYYLSDPYDIFDNFIYDETIKWANGFCTENGIELNRTDNY